MPSSRAEQVRPRGRPFSRGVAALFARCYRLFEGICLAAAVIGIAALFGAMAVTIADIVLRPMGHAVAGVVDLVQLMIMTAAFLTIPYTFVSDGHVSVDLLAQNLPPRVAAMLRVLAALLGTALLSLLLCYGWDSAMQQLAFGDRSHTIGIPLAWYWAPLLVGLGLSVIATLLMAGRELARAVARSDVVPPGDERH